MKTKFVKTLFIQSNPLDNGKYITDLGEFDFIDGEFKNELSQNVNGVDWYFQEVPDREEEMRELLEKIYNIENKEFNSTFNVDDLKRKIKRVLNK